MSLVEVIKALVEEEVKDSPFFVVDIVGGDRSRKIQVLIDGDKGVTVDQCSKISRSISKVVDDEDFEADPFILEVSSPGADEPLRNKRQYNKHVGRTLSIETASATAEFTLLEVKEDSILCAPVLDKKQKKNKVKVDPVDIRFDDIVTSTVVLSFK